MDPFDGNAYRKAVLRPLLDQAPGALDPFTVLAVPADEDDQAAIDRRVTEVVAFWRREQNSGRYRDLVTRLLDEREDLTAAVADPARRAVARQAAQASRAAADQERGARLDRMVERLVRSHPGGVPRSRLDRLRAVAARDGIGAAELTARLASVAVIDDTAEPLPEPEAAQVRSALAAYNQLAVGRGAAARSLFDVVGVEPTAPDEVVRARLDALAARNRQRRHDRLRTVTDELLTLAGRHTAGPGRARYQATMAAEARDRLTPDVEAVLLADDRVGAGEFEHLVREAVALGLDAGAARAAVIAVAADLGGAVETGPAVDYLRCPACGTAEVRDGRHRVCRRCGTALYRPCPACGHEVEASAYRCAHCGADLRALAEAERDRRERFEAASQLAGPERERALAELLADHPGFEPATRLLASTPPAPPAAVEASVGTGSVVVRWRPGGSPGVTAYRVTRQPAGGPARLVGQTQELALEDAGVRPGEIVRYAVVAVRGGRESPPVEVTPLDPATARVALTADDREITLAVVAPDRGDVRIVRTTAPPPAPGTRLAPAALAALGPVLPRGADPRRAVDLVAGGPRWYLPAVVDERGGAVAGIAVGHPGLAPVTGLAAEDAADHVLVRWVWPEGCTEAQVRWSGPAGDGQAKVTNMKYQIDGGFRLPAPADGAYRIAVAPGARVGRDLLWAPGASVRHRRG
jgi:hypothetical protein